MKHDYYHDKFVAALDKDLVCSCRHRKYFELRALKHQLFTELGLCTFKIKERSHCV